MLGPIRQTSARRIAVTLIFLMAPGAVLLAPAAFAQEPPQAQSAAPAAPALAPEQLDGLLAPIALYPDPLLSQVLVASTYPLEIVEASQFLQQNANLQGQALLDAAKQQNWDPSIQALVAFPDVIHRLSQDIRWTTDLGNAFLAQQADVMGAVQRLRQQARDAGKLNSTPQEVVTTQDQGGQSAVEIEPANPQVIYVPEYNPAYFWGDVYPYPPIWYPGIGVGFGFGRGISLGFYFGDWCCGWGGWGWGPNWFGGGIFVNGGFFHRYGFSDFHGGGIYGRSAWAHDPAHRLGVAYPNRALAAQFHGGAAQSGRNGGAAQFSGNRGFSSNAGRTEAMPRNTGPTERLGNREIPQRTAGENHSVFGPVNNGQRTRIQSDHGHASMPRSSGGGGGGFRGGGGGGGHAGGGGHGGGGRR
jgi:hypothetical protein